MREDILDHVTNALHHDRVSFIISSRLICLCLALAGIFPSGPANAADARPEMLLGTANFRLVPEGIDTARSPDGNRLAVMTYDGVVNIVDARVPSVSRKFSVGEEARMAFLTNDILLASDKYGRIVRWDVRTGKVERVIREGSGDNLDGVFALATSEVGARLAFASFRSSISVVDASSGRLVTMLGPNQSDATIFNLEFSPDGRRLASTSSAGEIAMWDVDKGTVVWSSRAYGSGEQSLGSHDPPKFAFRPDGRAIAVDASEGSVFVLDAETGRPRHELKGVDESIERISFMPDGRSIVVGSSRLRRIDAETGRELFSIQAAGRIDGLSVSNDGRRIDTFEQGGFVVIRDADTGREVKEGMNRFLWSAAYSENGKLLAAGASDGTIDLFELPSGRFLRRIETGGAVYHLSFSPDDRALAEGNLEKVQLWDPVSGIKNLELDRHDASFYGFAFSPDGRSLILLESESIVEYDARHGTRLRQIAQTPQYLKAMSVSRDGRYVAAGGSDGRAYVWDIKSGKEMFRGPPAENSWTMMDEVEFIDNGRELVGLLQNKGDLLRFSLPDGKLLERRPYGGCVRGTIMTPRGIALVSRDRCKVGNWVVRLAEGNVSVRPPTGALAGGGEVVAISPDGRDWVISAGDGPLTIWREP